jgi:hypothetical protein
LYRKVQDAAYGVERYLIIIQYIVLPVILLHDSTYWKEKRSYITFFCSYIVRLVMTNEAMPQHSYPYLAEDQDQYFCQLCHQNFCNIVVYISFSDA